MRIAGASRWRDNWRAIVPPGTIRIDVRSSRATRRDVCTELRRLPAGTPVVLASSAPWAHRRCAALALQAGVALERAYLAFPSAAAPAYLVEDAPASLSLFVDSMLVAPPQGRLAKPVALGVEILRRSPWRMQLLRLLAPGRLAVGSRT